MWKWTYSLGLVTAQTIHLDKRDLHDRPLDGPTGHCFAEYWSSRRRRLGQSFLQQAVQVVNLWDDMARLMDGDRTYQDLSKVFIGDITQLSTVSLGNHQLHQKYQALAKVCKSNRKKSQNSQLTAWPQLKGPMSRNARVRSLSKSLRLGIVPASKRCHVRI